MEHYVGLDVSLKQTSICVVDQTGSVVREGVVDSDPEAILVFVRSKAPDAVRIGLETGPTSTWLWIELKRLGLPVICIDARHAATRRRDRRLSCSLQHALAQEFRTLSPCNLLFLPQPLAFGPLFHCFSLFDLLFCCRLIDDSALLRYRCFC
jgi:hypothetical protein